MLQLTFAITVFEGPGEICQVKYYYSHYTEKYSTGMNKDCGECGSCYSYYIELKEISHRDTYRFTRITKCTATFLYHTSPQKELHSRIDELAWDP